MDLLENFKKYIKKENLFQENDRLLLAVSGGVDSVALCQLCRQAGYDFVIAHCNFQLRGEESNRDETFVRQLTGTYDVTFYVKRFDTLEYSKASKKSIEEAARQLRYDWFTDLTNTTGIKYIVTGHHADDNVETVAMNFFRGTGISGLRGILPKQGKIIRPLLFARRGELEEFVKNKGLRFVTDHTNLENNYTRNFFRNKIIPLVNEKFPEASNNVLRNIQRFKETEILYQQSVQLHKKKLLKESGNETHIPVLKLLKTVPLATVLYEIIKDFGFTPHQTDEAVALLKSESGKYIQSASHRIIRNRNWLIISPGLTIEASNILIEEMDTTTRFANGLLEIKKLNVDNYQVTNDNNVAMLNAADIRFPLLLRKWKQGDYFYPLGMQKKKKLGRFFTDNKLSLTQKENMWVIEMDKKIIWVVGMRIDERFKISNLTRSILVISFLSGTGN